MSKRILETIFPPRLKKRAKVNDDEHQKNSSANNKKYKNFSIPQNKALCQSFYDFRTAETNNNNNNNNQTSSSSLNCKPDILSKILGKIEEDSQNKKLNGRSHAFCADIIEVQIGYCINLEANSENIIHANYWRLDCDNNDRLKFSRHRTEGLFYMNYLQLKFEYEIETFQLACFIFDKYYQNSFTGPKFKIKEKYMSELAGVLTVASVSIFLAAKYEQIYPVKLSKHLQIFKNQPRFSDYRDIEDVTKNLKKVDNKQFLKLERSICRSLSFNLSRPSTVTYLRFYSFYMDLDNTYHKFSQFLVDLLLISNKTCHITPSIQAVAAIMMSRRFKYKSKFRWTNTDHKLTGYWCEDLKGVLIDLATSIVEIVGDETIEKSRPHDIYFRCSGMKEYLFKKYNEYFIDYNGSLKYFLEKHVSIPKFIIESYK